MNFLDKLGVLVSTCSVIWFPYIYHDIIVATRLSIFAYFGSREHLNHKQNDEYRTVRWILGGKGIFCKQCEEDGTIFRRERGKKMKKVVVLLSVIWPAFYGIMKNLLQPKLPKNTSFEDIVCALKNYYMPKPLVISERSEERRVRERVSLTV